MNEIFYSTAAILFILSIHGLNSPKNAQKSNFIGIIGMIIALLTILAFIPINRLPIIMTSLLLGGTIGIISGRKVLMTALPQMVAVFNGLGGLAAVLLSLGEIILNPNHHLISTISVIIGSLTFSGSMVAFLKLQGCLKITSFRGQQIINFIFTIIMIALAIIFYLSQKNEFFWLLTIISFIVGILLVLPIGGADMPIIISILNAASGWAAAGIGFMLEQPLLIITGAIIGASGIMLAQVMTKAMNASLIEILFFTHNKKTNNTDSDKKEITHIGSPKDAAFIMENAENMIIIPGYGMAAAHAQYSLKEMTTILEKKYHVQVRFAIHPVAGRMPGHMNVLLAEADIPYDQIFEFEDINRDFGTADVVYIIGANDITNPKAKDDKSSPIYGMPVFDVSSAKTVFFVKRSLNTGYAGIDNPLFYADNTIMLFGDAKKITESIVKELAE